MIVEFVVNNYQLGAKVKTTPVDKIAEQERIDKSHTRIRYVDVTEREKSFIEKVLAKRAKIIE